MLLIMSAKEITLFTMLEVLKARSQETVCEGGLPNEKEKTNGDDEEDEIYLLL